MTVLSDRDRRILDFEAGRWRYSGSKEQAIRDRFEMSPTRYYQTLNGVLERPEALSYAPGTVRRLRRLRDRRRAERSARRAV